MSFIARLQRAREILQQQGRLSTRALERELEIAGDELDELIEELVDVQQVARREGKILVWAGASASPPSDVSAGETRASSPAHRPAAPAEARKVVTIIFADLIGSTSLHERLDAESTRRLMDRYYRALHSAVEAHGGTVVKLMGDGVMAAFGVQRVAEDDAIRAVRAGMAMQDVFRELARDEFKAVGDIGLRVGINTGEVVVSADNTDVVGDPVNVAARLQTEAHDGEVVIGESTRRLVEALVTLAPLGSVALKGRSEAMKAYRVESLDRPVAATTAVFVGRDDELGRIRRVFEGALAAPAVRLAVLLGSPGLGKSRLIEEFARRLGDTATLLTAQCTAEGGATFAPLAEALRELLRVSGGGRVPLLGDEGESETDVLRAAIDAVPSTDASDRNRIVTGIMALLAGSPASPEETFFVVRRLLAALAAVRPVVLVIDDLQWAEPLLLDLVEHLVHWGSGMPLLVLVGARPELRDARSSLATSGGFVTDVVTLAGLDAGAATRLAANVIGAADLPAAVAAKLLATSEGNPLFVAELVRMLVQEGALRLEGERWTIGAGLAALEMPPTIHALLAARIERLRPEERSVLERAAVIGRHFSRSAVAALLPRAVTDLDARLEALRRSELIQPDTGWFLGEPVLRFHHVLIRDAAYRRLLKGTRVELHERVANWIESRAADSVEHDETLGWHLEQAHQFLGELGPIDAPGRALGERAARHLAAAGRRALARDDLPVAAGLLGRALDRLNPADPARADLALDWCEALLAAGDVGPAAAAIAELARFVPVLSDLTTNNVATNNLSSRLRAWHTCFTGQLTALAAPESLHATAGAVAAAAAELAALGDTAGEAKAHFVHAQAFARLGKIGACEAALDRALAAARRAGDRRRANTVLAVAPLAALWGPSPVTRASGRCLDVVRVLRITQGAPAVEAVALSCQGVLEALRGRADAARRMIASARQMVEELGITQRLLEADVFAGRIELLEGDALAAERCLRGAYDGLRALGLGIDAARAAALLGRALLAQGRAAEAESLSRDCEALAGDDLQASIAWRGVRAEALARRGEHADAVELAKAAVEIAAATDALLDHADARRALAAALRAAGRSADADAEERRAIELWEAKGATLLAERARRDGERAEPDAPPPTTRTEPARPVRGRVRPNAATADAARLDAVVAAGDEGALLARFADDLQVVDHTTGVVFDRQPALASYRGLMNARDPVCRHEPLATLGDSLALCRLLVSASGLHRGRLDIGAYDKEEIHLSEVGAQGRRRRGEVFATDHLGDAIARLYQRHAELLPKGKDRERATAMARSVAAMMSPPDPVRRAAVFAPDIELVDHRMLGTWSARGAHAVLRHFESVHQVADDPSLSDQNVLALAPDALLVLRSHAGAEKLGGGAYERLFLMLLATGADGRLARIEWFDEERVDEALARFDQAREALAPAEPSQTVRRRVRPNAATTFWARFDAAFAAQDADAIDASFSDAFAEIDHTTAASYGRDGALASIHRLSRAPDAAFRHEPLATLGPSLGLVRGLISASGTGGGRFDVGAYEIEEIKVTEVDELRQLRSAEVFARVRLGDAVARLYERYAELLPDGPERDRAAARARTAAVLGEATPDPDRVAPMLAPDGEYIDHNQLGYPTIRGADAMLRHYRSLFELATDVSRRVIDIVALTPEALLLRRLTSGTLRAGGGVFENRFLSLEIAGPDGLITHIEEFGEDALEEALARLDELVGNSEEPSPLGPFPAREGGSLTLPSRFGSGRDRGRDASAPFANAATRFCDCFVRAWAAHDWDAVTALHSPAHHNDDRRRLMQMRVAAEANLTQLRTLFEVPRSRMAMTPVATRGERLALSRILYEGDSDGGGGTLAIDYLGVIESDGDGCLIEIVLFDPGRMEAAFTELDARYDAGEGAAYAAHGAFMRAYAQAIASRDWDPVVALCAPALVEYDHRALAVLGTTRGAEAWVQNFRTLTDHTADTVYRVDHFRSAAHGFWSVGTWRGSREGGDYELPINAVLEMDDRDRLARSDVYDADQLDQARARFAQLAANVSAFSEESVEARGTDSEGGGAIQFPRFANAATRAVGRGTAALAARNWEGFAGLFATNFRHYDRTRIAQLETDGRQWLASFRQMVEMTSSRPTQQVLATRGERLALFRVLWRGAEGDIGPSEIDWVLIIEVDGRGDHSAVVAFDPDDLDTAYAELDVRYEAGEGAAHAHASAWVREFKRAFAARDWEAMAALHAPDQVAVNHRTVGWGTLRGPGAWVPTLQALVELAADTRFRLDHLRTCERGILWQSAWQGTRDGGAFETPQLVVTELDDRGRQIRMDVWDADVSEPARARFTELTGKGFPLPPPSGRGSG